MPALRFHLAIFVSVLAVGAVSAQPLPLTGKPARVDRFGDALPPSALFRIGTSRLQLDRQIQNIAASADGKLVAAVSDDSLGVWEVPSGREILRRTPSPHWGSGFLSFSPDGKLLAFNANQGLILFDLEKGQERAKLGSRASVGGFAPDGKTVAVKQTSIDGHAMAVAQWDVASGKLLDERQFEYEFAPEFTDGSISPDCKMLATFETQSKPLKQIVSLHDVATGKALRRWEIAHPMLRKIVFSPDGRLVAGPSADAVVRVWDVATGKERARWKMNGGVGTGASGFTFAPDGASILCAQSSGIARLDWQTGKLVQEFQDVGGPIALLAVGRTMAVQGSLGSIRLLDLQSGKDLCPLPRAGKYVTFSADARLVAWSEGSAIVLAETQTGKAVRRWQAHVRYVSPLAFAPDGKTIASAGTDRRIRLWDVASGQALYSMIKNGVDTLFFSPDSRRLASAGLGEVCMWDAASGERQGLWAAKDIAMAPDFHTVVVPDDKAGVLRLFDSITGKRLHELPGYRARVRSPFFATSHQRDLQMELCPAFSSDGRRLVVGGGGHFKSFQGAIYLWDVVTGSKVPPVLSASEFVPQGLRISPDGRLLAVLRFDHKMCLLSTASGTSCEFWAKPKRTFGQPQRSRPTDECWSPRAGGWSSSGGRHGGEIARQPAHRDDVRELIVSANGRCLATTSWDHAILIWDLTRLATDDRPRDVVLAAAELPALWADLASPAAVKGRRRRALIAAPQQAVPLLRERLKSAPMPDAKKLARWVADLGSDVFERRQEAEDELDRLGVRAGPALRQGLAGEVPLEARRRIEQLLAKLVRPATLSGEPLRMVRAVQVLEGAGDPGALWLLRELAQGGADALVTDEAAAAVRRLEQRAKQAMKQ